MIDSFKGEYRFLSNFYPSPIHVAVKEGEHLDVPTVEHLYQSSKTHDPMEIAIVLAADTPGQAKREGRRVTMQPHWDEIKLDTMLRILRIKFEQNPSLAAQLVETYPHELVEGNHWNDTFWGVCKGEGENWLGRLLMIVRSGLMVQP